MANNYNFNQEDSPYNLDNLDNLNNLKNRQNIFFENSEQYQQVNSNLNSNPNQINPQNSFVYSNQNSTEQNYYPRQNNDYLNNQSYYNQNNQNTQNYQKFINQQTPVNNQFNQTRIHQLNNHNNYPNFSEDYQSLNKQNKQNKQQNLAFTEQNPTFTDFGQFDYPENNYAQNNLENPNTQNFANSLNLQNSYSKPESQPADYLNKLDSLKNKLNNIDNKENSKRSDSSYNPKKGFNYWLTSFFLNNSRLTILTLISLIIFGLLATFSLKATGFPNPEIKIVILQTLYPGASSKTVLKDVTIPLENAIKEVEGVSRINSTSSNSFSLIRINLKENLDVDNLVNKIESAVRTVNLPSGVNTPIIRKPTIGGPDIIYAITGENLQDLYEVSSQFEQAVSELTEISKIESPSKLEKLAIIKLDTEKALTRGVQANDVLSALKSFNESIPVVNNVEIDGKNTSILTTLKSEDQEILEKLKNLPIKPSIPIFSTNLARNNLNNLANQDLSSSVLKDSNQTLDNKSNNSNSQTIENSQSSRQQNNRNTNNSSSLNNTQNNQRQENLNSNNGAGQDSENLANSRESNSRDLGNNNSNLNNTLNSQNSSQNQTFPFSTAQSQNNQAVLVNLKDIADIQFDYRFKNQKDWYGFIQKDNTIEDNPRTQKAVEVARIVTSQFFYLNAVENTDQTKFVAKVKEKLAKLNSEKVVVTNKNKVGEEFQKDKVNIIKVYATAEDNQKQVQEVISGLIGGPLGTEDSLLAQVGWLLGGIQLVVLVMIAFVSWRAALIAGLSIPLSLIFTNIYLLIIGESFNTLVLFSLVLVIGLVVDPALVILEAIQRKIDAGFEGKEAVLKAVLDVGSGIFLAALTNIIVFTPFGVLSGFLGQIFAYIPLTIIPATVGSYIVPLIFLAWLGGLTLKPSKQVQENIQKIKQQNISNEDIEKILDKMEEENMWPIAKLLKNLNYKILHSPAIIRFLIIILTLGISLGIAGFYTVTGQVKNTSFATNKKVEVLLLSINHKLENSLEKQVELERKIIEKLLTYNQVLEIYPYFGQGTTYRINIDLKRLENGQNSFDLAKKINQDLQEEFKNDFFDLNLVTAQNGPSGNDYQLSVAVFTDDLDLMRKSSEEVGKKFLELCLDKNKQVILDKECQEEGQKRMVTKVDDGFTGKTNKTIEVLLDRQKLLEKQAVIANAPLSILVNQTIANLFQFNQGQSIIKIENNTNSQEKNKSSDQISVLLESQKPAPKTIEEIRNIKIQLPTGQQIPLTDLATIQEVNPPQSIQRNRSKTLNLIQARLDEDLANDQSIVQRATRKILEYFSENNFEKTIDLGLEKESIARFDDGSASDFLRSLQELLLALVIAIIISYFVLVLFFKSFAQPLAIIYTIPLTFIGIYPGLAYFGGGEIGFLEIIGIIILVGVVENVAIFLIETANQKITAGLTEKEAISYAAGIRFRPVFLTSLTALASLTPLAFFSVFYRSIAIVIISGILTSGILSLITTPILFIFFRWLSREFQALDLLNQITFLISPILGLSLFILPRVNSEFANFSQNLPDNILNYLALSLLIVPLIYLIYMSLKPRQKTNF